MSARFENPVMIETPAQRQTEGVESVLDVQGSVVVRRQSTRRALLMGIVLVGSLGGISLVLHRIESPRPWIWAWPGMVVVTLALVTSVTDSKWHKIPNWMTYPAILAGIVIGSIVTFVGPSSWVGNLDLQSSLSGLLVCFVCMLFPYRASGGGAGDVKIVAAYGALLGWQIGLSILIWGYLAAGLVLLVGHLFSEQPWLLPTALGRWIGSTFLPQSISAPNESQKKTLARPIPLAGAFAVGLVCVLNGGNLFGV